MTSRGGYSDPTASGGSDSNAVGASGLQIGLITASGSDSFTNDGSGFNGCGTAARTAIANQDNISSNGTIFAVSKLGTVGINSNARPSNGTTGGATIQTGAGGSGGRSSSSGGYSYGGDAGCFSGGTGGGSGMSGGTGGAGVDFGGRGGAGSGSGSSSGCGNPAGSATYVGENGCAGLIWLIVSGDLTIGSGGSLQANGAKGHGDWSISTGAGSGGGGAVQTLYAGTLSNSGAIEANAGPISGSTGATSTTGNRGGDGGVNTTQISGGTSYNDMTLVSNATTAESTPTTGDIVMTYTNGAGTATVNTDIKAWISRDNGTTYTQGTLVSEGTTGSDTILAARRVDISGQPSGTSMRYKITTHNQSVAKETRLQAASLAWA